MISIRDIPADILYTIAQHLTSCRDLVFVCKRWHNIVLFAPSLWTNIHIIFPNTRIRPRPELTPERVARAALRRAGPVVKLSLHLEIHEIYLNSDNITAVMGMIRSRGYQRIRALTLDGSFGRPLESLSRLVSHLLGDWSSLLRLHFEPSPSMPWGLSTIVSLFDCVTSTAPALHSIRIRSDFLPLVDKTLSRKQSLVHLDIIRSLASRETLMFSVWPNIKSLNISTTTTYDPSIENQLVLRAIDPSCSADGAIAAFPSLTHAVITNHALYCYDYFRLESLTDLVLNCVTLKSNDPVVMPLLRNLSAATTRGIASIIAPRLETLCIGPLPESIGVTEYLAKLFTGNPHQLDPIYLDLRPIYKEQDSHRIDLAVPLAAVYRLKRVERVSIARLAEVRSADRWKYQRLESVNFDLENSIEAMVMLPKWKELDLGGDQVPDWLWEILNARQVAGFPVQLNLTNRTDGTDDRDT